ncbi:hypothetical protein Tco_0475758 [Tanacetum coccineum]
MKVKESLNVTFDETPSPSKTSPLEDDDLVEEEAIKLDENGVVSRNKARLVAQGYCDNHDLSRFDNQSIERDRLIEIGFVLDFVEFISFTFSDKEMILGIEAVSR